MGASYEGNRARYDISFAIQQAEILLGPLQGLKPASILDSIDAGLKASSTRSFDGIDASLKASST